MMSSDGSEPLACFRITGWPRVACPRDTSSTTLGCAYVPSSRLKNEPHGAPHAGVAALAGRAVSAIAAPTMVTVAAAPQALLLMDIALAPLTNRSRAVAPPP